MVICLERDADLHIAQLIPLPLTVSCFSSLVLPAHPGSPGQRAVKRVFVDDELLLILTEVTHDTPTLTNVHYNGIPLWQLYRRNRPMGPVGRVASNSGDHGEQVYLAVIFRWVYDSRHLQADCKEPGSAPEPYAP